MKQTRVFAAFLALLMMATFTACGSKNNGTNDTPTGTSQAISTVESSSSEAAPSVTPPDDAQVLQDFIDNYSKEYDFTAVEVSSFYPTSTGVTVEAQFIGQELVYDREPYYLYLVNAELSYTGSDGNWVYSDMHESKREHRLSPFVLGLMEGYHEGEKNSVSTSYTIGNIAEDGSSFTITDYVLRKGDATYEIPEIEMKIADRWSFGSVMNEALYFPSDYEGDFSRLVSDATNGEYPRLFVRITHLLGNSNLDILCALEKSQPDGIRIMLVEN